VEAIATAEYDWPLLHLDLSPETVEESLVRARDCLSHGNPLRRTHARIDIRGESTAAEWVLLERFSDEMTADCASFDLRGQSDVRLVVVPEDIQALDAQGSVREAAEALATQSKNPDLSRDDRQIASEALRLLFRYAGETL